MARSRLDVVASTFGADSEALHEKFLQIRSDAACTGCKSAGFGEAILTAWLQTKWADFTRDLVTASTLGTRRAGGNAVPAVAGVRTLADAEMLIRKAATEVFKKSGHSSPVWHSPRFVIEVSTRVRLNNLPKLEASLGPTLIPKQITDFRNYLVHPSQRTRQEYEALQAELGLFRVEPEDLLHQQQKPGLPVFTSWVRELQRIAYDSAQ